MTESNLYFRGVPILPDVQRIREEFPDMKALRGETITHETIERLIEQPRTSNRYRSVIAAWKRVVRAETGVVIRGNLTEVIGIGFRILSYPEQNAFGVYEMRGAGRKMRSSHKAFSDTDPKRLSQEQRQIREHGMSIVKMLQTHMVESRKFLVRTTEPPETQPIPGSPAAEE